MGHQNYIERAATNKTYRITMAILADRSAGHSGPSSAYKPFGDVLRLMVLPNWLAGLKDRHPSRLPWSYPTYNAG